jgi:hypothetical protein
MLTALQLLVIYAAIGFVPVAFARLVAGTHGARATAQFVFWRVPAWFIIGVFYLVVDPLLSFLRRPTVTSFVPDEPPPAIDEEPMPSEPPAAQSLAQKMRQRNAEELSLIRQLCTYSGLDQQTLSRAFELELIDHISVQHHQTADGDFVTRSFVLRAPVSISKPEPQETTT